MWKSSDRLISIDMRSSVEVLLLGSLHNVDAHIPYRGGDLDEWSELYRAYSNPVNNLFLLSVNELLMEQGLNRNSSIRLIASSYRRGIMAANILLVAGYENVVVELDRERNTPPAAVVKEADGDSDCSWNGRLYWTNSDNGRQGGWLH
ncbi:MAG: hypothetical protein AB2531_09860 [Candidatus Thiodiazotropha sp.]